MRSIAALVLVMVVSTGHFVALSAGAAEPSRVGGARERESRQDVASCVADANGGQTLRQAGRYVDARSSFERCARPVCPSVVRAECATWAGDVARELAVLDIRVVDERNAPQAADEVTVDARQAREGTVELDPGPHIVRARVGASRVESSIIVARGERRSVTLVVATPLPRVEPRHTPASDSSDDSSRASLRVSAPVIGGLALGGTLLAGGAITGVVARNRVDTLSDRCAPRCSADDVSGVKTTAFVADVLFVAGAAAVLASGVWLIVDNQRSSVRREVRATQRDPLAPHKQM